MADSVFLEGLRFHAFHGITQLERKIGVRYAVVTDPGQVHRIGSTCEKVEVAGSKLSLEYKREQECDEQRLAHDSAPQ